MSSPKRAVLLWSLIGLLGALIAPAPPAQAWWFSKEEKEVESAEDKVRTFQPPPPDALEMYCDPHRQEAAELSDVPRIFKIFVQPVRAWHIRKHQNCKAELMEQEYQYLKHVDVQRAPSLPKLRTEEAVPPESPEKQSPVQPEEAPDDSTGQ